MKTVIKQLEKALECEDDKELRLRVEILLDFLKDRNTPQYEVRQPVQMPQPVQPSQPTPRGAGPIISNGEQINYTRPKGM